MPYTKYGYKIETSEWGFSVVDPYGSELALFEKLSNAKAYIEWLETNIGYKDYHGKFVPKGE